MTLQLDRSRPIPDTLIFDLRESRKGLRINTMCDALTTEANREACKADTESFMTRFGLSEQEKDLVRRRDWAGLNEHGGNIYYLLKLGFVLGHGLYRMGAQMRGESFDEFLASRTTQGAR
ncbi:MAG: protocatechuate 3,4-dioxygenase [Alcaligenaceae bacterium]|nr:protocatechuate 3,4-dioxygenase [Alcaligenaceae bacterium]